MSHNTIGGWKVNEILIAMPAYGRTYATLEDTKRDWSAGKDFKMYNGPYFSIRDVAELKYRGYLQVQVMVVVGSDVRHDTIPL